MSLLVPILLNIKLKFDSKCKYYSTTFEELSKIKVRTNKRVAPGVKLDLALARFYRIMKDTFLSIYMKYG